MKELRPTKARALILTIIDASQKPLLAAEIVTKTQKKDSKINRATVFRSLNTLAGAGEVVKVDFGDGVARYESAHLDHHHHLICDTCGAVDDIDICLPKTIDPAIKKAKKFTVTRHSLEFHGVCENCL